MDAGARPAGRFSYIAKTAGFPPAGAPSAESCGRRRILDPRALAAPSVSPSPRACLFLPGGWAFSPAPGALTSQGPRGFRRTRCRTRSLSRPVGDLARRARAGLCGRARPRSAAFVPKRLDSVTCVWGPPGSARVRSGSPCDRDHQLEPRSELLWRQRRRR